VPKHIGGGCRSSSAQQAYDTVVAAAISSNNTPGEKNEILKLLGVRRRRSKLLAMIANSVHGGFKCKDRKVRGIESTNIVKSAVKLFSRDDDNSWDDPNVRISVIEDGEPISCKIWFDPTWAMRVDACSAEQQPLPIPVR